MRSRCDTRGSSRVDLSSRCDTNAAIAKSARGGTERRRWACACGCKEHAASARAAEVVAVEEELRLLDGTSSSEGDAEDVGVTGRDGAGAKDDDKQRNEYLARGEDVGHSWT